LLNWGKGISYRRNLAKRSLAVEQLVAILYLGPGILLCSLLPMGERLNVECISNDFQPHIIWRNFSASSFT
jgi:hypothetical protein